MTAHAEGSAKRKATQRELGGDIALLPVRNRPRTPRHSGKLKSPAMTYVTAEARQLYSATTYTTVTLKKQATLIAEQILSYDADCRANLKLLSQETNNFGNPVCRK